MTTLRNLVDDHYRGLESGDVALATRGFAKDVRCEFPLGPVEGIDAFTGLVAVFVTAFPDLRVERRNTWQDGSTVVVEAQFSGTQTGPMHIGDDEIPPSGRPLTFPLVDTFTLSGEHITEHRGYWDNVSFLTQLGLMPAPADV